MLFVSAHALQRFIKVFTVVLPLLLVPHSLTVHVPGNDDGDLVLVEQRLDGAHGGLRLPLSLVGEVGVVPRAVHHGHDPRG